MKTNISVELAAYVVMTRVNPALPPKVTPAAILAAAILSTRSREEAALDMIDLATATPIPATNKRWLCGTGRQHARDRGGRSWAAYKNGVSRLLSEEQDYYRVKYWALGNPIIVAAVRQVAEAVDKDAELAAWFGVGMPLRGAWLCTLAQRREVSIERARTAARSLRDMVNPTADELIAARNIRNGAIEMVRRAVNVENTAFAV